MGKVYLLLLDQNGAININGGFIKIILSLNVGIMLTYVCANDIIFCTTLAGQMSVNPDVCFKHNYCFKGN